MAKAGRERAAQDAATAAMQSGKDRLRGAADASPWHVARGRLPWPLVNGRRTVSPHAPRLHGGGGDPSVAKATPRAAGDRGRQRHGILTPSSAQSRGHRQTGSSARGQPPAG